MSGRWAMLIQCSPLLVIRGVWKASLLYTHLYSVYPYWWWGMSGRWACCLHAYTVYTPNSDEGCQKGESVVHTYTPHWWWGMSSRRRTLALKPMRRVTRSPKQKLLWICQVLLIRQEFLSPEKCKINKQQLYDGISSNLGWACHLYVFQTCYVTLHQTRGWFVN